MLLVENSIDFFPLCLLKCKYKESLPLTDMWYINGRVESLPLTNMRYINGCVEGIVLHRKVEDFLILKSAYAECRVLRDASQGQ